MKIPTICPICHQPMTNNFVQYKELEVLVKECHCISHRLKYEIDANDDRILLCRLNPIHKNIAHVIWHPERQPKIIVYQGGANLVLPYFEPDFSNYPALLNKLKTYMVFS